jgi:hypothetical protein
VLLVGLNLTAVVLYIPAMLVLGGSIDWGLARVPRDITNVIAEYGACLERVATEPHSAGVYPLSELPYPKESIARALNAALTLLKDDQLREQVKIARVCLDDFLPTEELQTDPRYIASKLVADMGLNDHTN